MENSLPLKHPEISKIIADILNTFLVGKYYLFQFRVSSNRTGRTSSLEEILKLTRDVANHCSSKLCLVASHVRYLGQNNFDNIISMVRDKLYSVEKEDSVSIKNKSLDYAIHDTSHRLHESLYGRNESENWNGNESVIGYPADLQSYNSDDDSTEEKSEISSLQNKSYISFSSCDQTSLSNSSNSVLPVSDSGHNSSTRLLQNTSQENYSSHQSCDTSQFWRESCDISQFWKEVCAIDDGDQNIETYQNVTDYKDDLNLLSSQFQHELLEELKSNCSRPILHENPTDGLLSKPDSYSSGECVVVKNEIGPSLFSKPDSYSSSECEFGYEVMNEIEADWQATQTGLPQLHLSTTNIDVSFVSPFWKRFPTTQKLDDVVTTLSDEGIILQNSVPDLRDVEILSKNHKGRNTSHHLLEISTEPSYASLDLFSSRSLEVENETGLPTPILAIHGCHSSVSPDLFTVSRHISPLSLDPPLSGKKDNSSGMIGGRKVNVSGMIGGKKDNVSGMIGTKRDSFSPIRYSSSQFSKSNLRSAKTGSTNYKPVLKYTTTPHTHRCLGKRIIFSDTENQCDDGRLCGKLTKEKRLDVISTSTPYLSVAARKKKQLREMRDNGTENDGMTMDNGVTMDNNGVCISDNVTRNNESFLQTPSLTTESIHLEMSSEISTLSNNLLSDCMSPDIL